MKMRKLDAELVVGLFMVAGIACLGWLSIRLGGLEVIGGGRYELKARFSQIGGLKTAASVVIAGVEVGRVRAIRLEDYRATVTLAINQGVEIHEDAIASIRTRGLIGEKYVEVSPGGSDVVLKPGEFIRETEPAVDIEALISKYVFSGDSGVK